MVSQKRPERNRTAHLCQPQADQRRYRRSVPNVPDQPDACDYQSHGPSPEVPKSTKWCREPNPPGTSRPERLPRPSATQPEPARDNLAHPSHGSPKRPERSDQPVVCAYPARDPDSNPRAPRMVSQKRPKGSANPRAHVVSQTQRPWCRRSVPQSTKWADLSPNPDSQSGSHPNPQQRWSLLECAATWPLLAVRDPRCRPKTTPISSADQ